MERTGINHDGLTAQEINALENRPVSVGAMMADSCARFADEKAFMWPDIADHWQSMTYAELLPTVDEIAAGYLALGIGFEERVAIAAATRIEWVLADLAQNRVGIATTSIYPNTQADECHHILQDSGSVMVVVANGDLLAKVTQHEDLAQQLRHIVLLDGEPDAADPRQISWSRLRELGREHLAAHPDAVAQRAAQVRPDTLATLIYTSGTTGRPKGVELTHDNWVYQGVAMRLLDAQERGDIHYIWLPMSHVFGKDLIMCNMAYGATVAIDGRIDKIVENLKVVRPHVMCGAPRIFEKVRAAVLTSSPRSGVKGRLARWAFSVGRKAYPYRSQGKPMPRPLAAQYALADRLVFSKLRELLGGRIKVLISGSAKLSPQVQEWFYSAGIRIEEGFGSTETCAIATFDWPDKPRFGTVGPVSKGSWVKIADDGEILLKGPGITRGYYRDPERTAEAFEDGWFKTGDVGHVRADGNVVITDRKKDLMKTSGGKYVSPQEVEAAVMANIPYVSQAVIVGEGRKYVSALLVLDPVALKKWAAKRNIEGDYATLSQLPEIRRSIDKFMARANSKLERWETVKRFAILDHELSVSSGDVTPSMKIRRDRVIERYADVVESLYDADVPEDVVR